MDELHLPDIQAMAPERQHALSRVGVRGVRKPVKVTRPDGRSFTLVVDFDVFVDLPASQKGVHMSRNLEAVAQLIDAEAAQPVRGLEDLAARLAVDLLDKHDYASDTEVRCVADYFLERTFTTQDRVVKSDELYRIIAEGKAIRSDDGAAPEVRKLIGVEVTGMTACPCAMETSRALLAARGIIHPDNGPTITHNQRNVAALLLEVPVSSSVEVDELIELVESSLSAPTFEILKRRMEGELVVQAHDKPMFVEDVVREILDKVRERFTDLPDDAHVIARSEALESIHKHNAYGERITTLGELRHAA